MSWFKKEETPPPGVYEVGSSEYNAQIVGKIREINETLTAKGKHTIPERVAIDIINRAEAEGATGSYYCGLCGKQRPIGHFPH